MPITRSIPRSWLSGLLRVGGIAVAIAAAVVAVRAFDLRAVLSALERANLVWLVPALAVVAVQLLLRALRLRTLLPASAPGGTDGLAPVTGAMLVSQLVNNVSPARIGDGVKCYLVSRQRGIPFTGVLGVLMLEHGLDSSSLAVVSAIAVTVLGVTGPIRTIATVAGLAGLVVLIAIFITDLASMTMRLRHRLDPAGGHATVGRLLEGVAHFGGGFTVVGRRRLAAIGLAIGLLAWLCDGFLFWTVSRSLGLSLSPAAAMLIAAAVALSTILPGGPGYVGTLELAVVGAASAVGLVGPAALALALVYHFIQFVPVSIAGLVAVALGGHRVSLPASAAHAQQGALAAPEHAPQRALAAP